MDGGHADFLQRHGAEHFAEAGDGFVEQDFHRIGGNVALEHAGAASNQHNVGLRLGNGGGNDGADIVALVAAPITRVQHVACGLQGFGQIVATAVFGGAAGVGYGEQVDAEGAEFGCGAVHLASGHGKVGDEADFFIVQIVVFGFFGNGLMQITAQAFGIAFTQMGAQVVGNTAEQAQVHFALGGNAQAVAAFAEIFAVGGDEADAAGEIAVEIFPCGAGVRLARQQLPALRLQAAFDFGGGEVLAVEEAAVVAGLHQFDEAQGYGALAHEIERVGQRALGVAAQQQGVDFDVAEAFGQDVVERAQDVGAFALAGDFEEYVRVEAVDTDVNFVQSGSAVGWEELRQSESVGGKCHVFNQRVDFAHGDDVGQIAAQGGLAAGEADFARTSGSEHVYQSFDFWQGKFVGLGFALVAVGQAVGAAVVAQVGNRQPQVAQAAVVGVGECVGRGHNGFPSGVCRLLYILFTYGTQAT